MLVFGAMRIGWMIQYKQERLFVFSIPTTLDRCLGVHQLHSIVELLLRAGRKCVRVVESLPRRIIALRLEAVGNAYQICLEHQQIVWPWLAVQVTLWLIICEAAELFDSFFNTACRLC